MNYADLYLTLKNYPVFFLSSLEGQPIIILIGILGSHSSWSFLHQQHCPLLLFSQCFDKPYSMGLHPLLKEGGHVKGWERGVPPATAESLSHMGVHHMQAHVTG